MLFVTENIETVYTPSGDQPDTTTGQTSLEEIYNQNNLDTAYVSRTNLYYRWYAGATDAPNGQSIVIPKGYENTQPGRWFRQGPPGPGGNRLPRGALTATGRAHLLFRASFFTNGGATQEYRQIILDTTQFMFDETTAIAVAAIAQPLAAPPSAPNSSISPFVRNNRIHVWIDGPQSGGNVPAGARVDVWVWRSDDRIAQPSHQVT